MSEFNITVKSGASVRLKTAGKYCDRDIVVKAEGGSVNAEKIAFVLGDGIQIPISDVKGIDISEGSVLSIICGDAVLWERPTYKRELQYLESTGTQYIDTGVMCTTSTDYEFVGAITETTKTGWIVGAPTWIGIHKKADTVAATQASTGHIYNTVGVNEIFTIGLFGNKAYFNGVETGTSIRKKSTLTMFLFAYHHTTDTGSIYSSVRMNSFKMWENGNIVRDFIPVLDFDDVPCMYDKISGQFFYNQGTGEFLYE